MTNYERRVFDIERQMDRRARWVRVRTVFGYVSLAVMTIWAVSTGVVFLFHWWAS